MIIVFDGFCVSHVNLLLLEVYRKMVSVQAEGGQTDGAQDEKDGGNKKSKRVFSHSEPLARPCCYVALLGATEREGNFFFFSHSYDGGVGNEDVKI